MARLSRQFHLISTIVSIGLFTASALATCAASAQEAATSSNPPAVAVLALDTKWSLAPEEEKPESSPSSPPLETDDPGTPGTHGFEINFIHSCDIAKGDRGCESDIDAAFGIGPRAQLRISKGVTTQHTSGQPDFTGVGQTNIGVKYRFYDHAGLQFATYPSIELNDASKQIGPDGPVPTEGTSIYLPLIVSKEINTVTVVANVGRRLNLQHPENNSTFTSVSIGHAISKRARVMAEVASEKTGPDRRTDLRIGGVWVALPKVAGRYQVSLFTSAARRVQSPDGKSHVVILGGVSVARQSD